MEATLVTWSLCPSYLYKCTVLCGPEGDHQISQSLKFSAAGRNLDLSCSNHSLSINVIVIICAVEDVEYGCERMNCLLQYHSLKICFTYFFSLSFCFQIQGSLTCISPHTI
jgi:hypothetical protein